MAVSLATIRLQAGKQLLNHPTTTPYLDTEILLAHALRMRRETLLALPPHATLDRSAYKRFRHALAQRCAGSPIAYIVAEKEFYGDCYRVSKHTLIPRPESEQIIDQIGALQKKFSFLKTLHDCGSGAGNLAIAAKKYCALDVVSASDISVAAIKIAQLNARAILGSADAIMWMRGSLLKPLKYRRDIIVANLPYLTKRELSEPTIQKEPKRALYGGDEQGLRLILQTIKTAGDTLNTNGFLILECAPAQVDAITHAMQQNNFVNIEAQLDLAGNERIICGQCGALSTVRLR